MAILNVNSINLNGHTLYVNGVAYNENTISTGNAIEIKTSDSKSSDAKKSDSKGGSQEKPSDEQSSKGTPPKKPE